eukprot:TRINITY_DN10691_c0_g3_i1.p2 TRINITY_DN10691_c0_g3~~TRINITY_DN10691_c0_g3_i1.p2  ORF type:complete len:116 (-),score=30.10 TRINITY_DN10691_c0_g3_i1:268-615(-)
MGAACCEIRYKDTYEGSSFSSNDVNAIEDIYQLAAFPPEPPAKNRHALSYQEILEALSCAVKCMESAGKLPKRILLDWQTVSALLSERAADCPTSRCTISRDAFFRLWEIADDRR